jgi:hypothetical protein
MATLTVIPNRISFSSRMDAFTIVPVWFFGSLGGGLLAIGVAHLATGRVVLSKRQGTWSVREARLLGWGWIVQGAAVGVYTLHGGLSLGAHLFPLFGVGHWWGLFVPDGFFLPAWGALLFQTMVVARHDSKWPFKRSGQGA